MMAKLNQKQIEMMSVVKLREALLRTGFADPDILENDTTPSWDGEIRLYKTQGDFSKENLHGKIPVQVKGTCVDKFPKGKASFSVDVADLSNYQQSHGVMFFLVQMKGFDEYKIYYAALLPFDLREKLAKAKGQKTKAIKLDVFPHKYINGMIKILTEFLIDWRKQGKLIPTVWSVQDLARQSVEIESLEVSISMDRVPNKDEFARELLSKPHFVYAKIKGLDAVFAVDTLRPTMITTSEKLAVAVNGEVLFDHIKIIRNQHKEPIIQIGSGIQFIAENENVRLSYSCQGMLQELLKDLRLIVALIQDEEVTIGGRSFPKTCITASEEEIQKCTAELLGLETIAKMLKSLHVTRDLNIGLLTEQDEHILDLLVYGINEGKPVPLNVNENFYGKLTLGNLNFLLCVRANPDGEGAFISNFFSQNHMTVSDDNMGQESQFPVSPYVMVSAKTIQEADNANIEEVVSSITSVPYSQLYGAYVMRLVLDFLKLYDVQPNAIILDVVVSLIDFLEKNDPEERDTLQINRLQAEKRRRKLTKAEVKYLMSLKDPATSTEFQLAASILLGSYQEAQILYESLAPEVKTEFDEFPIMHLWRQM